MLGAMLLLSACSTSGYNCSDYPMPQSQPVKSGCSGVVKQKAG